MSPRTKPKEVLPKFVAECAGCGIRFEVQKTMHDKIKEDEFVDFILDPTHKRSLLIATVYLPRCPQCTNLILKAADRAKVKTTVPVLLFETEVKDEPAQEETETEEDAPQT